jgi:hypothetical protein
MNEDSRSIDGNSSTKKPSPRSLINLPLDPLLESTDDCEKLALLSTFVHRGLVEKPLALIIGREFTREVLAFDEEEDWSTMESLRCNIVD